MGTQGYQHTWRTVSCPLKKKPNVKTQAAEGVGGLVNIPLSLCNPVGLALFGVWGKMYFIPEVKHTPGVVSFRGEEKETEVIWFLRQKVTFFSAFKISWLLSPFILLRILVSLRTLLELLLRDKILPPVQHQNSCGYTSIKGAFFFRHSATLIGSLSS